MKRKSWVAAIGLAVVVSIGWLVAYSLTTDTRVEFADNQLELAVQAELQLDRPIREQDLASMTALSLRGRGVENLEDLHYFPNLRQLNIRDNSISDLTPLKYTPQLQRLNAQNNRISDLSQLPQLTQLRELNVEDNLLVSLEGVEQLTSLVDLNVRDNQIVDLSPLSDLEYLEILNLRDNQIEELSPLETFANLKDLNVRNNQIESFKALENLPLLQDRLYVEGNPYENDPVLDGLYHRVNDIDFTDPTLRVIASQDSGFVEGAFDLSLSSQREGLIRYTLDGSEPTTSSEAYRSPVTISEDTVIRAKLFLPNGDVGETLTRTYYFDENTASVHPTLSLVMNPAHLYGEERGILANENRTMKGLDWEREVALDYFKPGEGEEPSFSQSAGIRVYNRDKTNYEYPSLMLLSDREYGVSSFQFELFQAYDPSHQRPIIIHHNTMLSEESMMSRALYIVSGASQGLESSPIEAVNVYMNGEKWGLFLTTAGYNSAYLASIVEGDKREIEIVEGNGTLLEGEGQALKQLISILDNEPQINSIEEVLDVENFFHFMIHQAYYGKKDLSESRLWYSPEKGWRWLNDQAYMSFNPEEDVLEAWLNDEAYQNILAIRIFNLLMEDEGHRESFVKMYMSYLETIYDETQQQSLLDEWQNAIKSELPPADQLEWEQEYAERENFIQNRSDYILDELNTLF
ncbi:chitobiase/beta-hexosaminidase C-terminal domain-containing protein [Alkalihalophilus lindianensis]|uniref:Chitobiase/beta-hexosaminidase C-terminal domain-containing protein n=1 Tax=Alkalihalophilus lindianensis TaxID=1630542 RepID=A0ABU3X8X3_9BACI|nr:leucine-rich repeat domain-containing protein [Alkalihalophilus lindianensis]MDV2684334.1 chitobiase/beta-hexosaminidase C-terminal domain-containing protein [Alkalihalophilus lindianensis]